MNVRLRVSYGRLTSTQGLDSTECVIPTPPRLGVLVGALQVEQIPKKTKNLQTPSLGFGTLKSIQSRPEDFGCMNGLIENTGNAGV